MTSDNKLHTLISFLKDIQWSLAAGKDKSQTIRKKSYSYIPGDEDIFLEDLEKVIEIQSHIKNPKFLDVGCGIGFKLLLAQIYCKYCGVNLQVEGLDHTEKYLKTAKKFLPKGTPLYHCDALKFENYKDYDIIYYWTPFADRDLQDKLVNKILTEAKSGCLIWSFLGGLNPDDTKEYSFDRHARTSVGVHTWKDCPRCPLLIKKVF